MTTPTTVNVRLQLRADTAANWTAANPILLANEVGLETDTKKLKVGNGSTAWNSLAYFPSIVSGGTVLGNLEIGSTGTLTFEGSTADGFETTLAVTNPTADRTITLPNQSGTVVVSGNASIVDADIAANAEIAVSKLANGTANQVIVTDGTNVSWSDDLTLAGNLTVNGTTTTINTQDLLVEDKNIILGNVDTPTDVTADGGGITLKGATDKTINWVDATDAWTSSERFSLPLGSDASPSLTFTGDENTGIYSPGADQVALSTNGTGRLFVDASGEIGIGTANPNRFLTINDASQPDLALSVGDAEKLRLQSTSSENYVDLVGQDLVLRGGPSGSSERLRITSTGLVGIGTSAPQTLLDLSANSETGSNTLRFTDSDTLTVANQQIGKIEFYSADASTPGAGVKAYIGAFAEDTSPDAYLAFATDTATGTPTERLRITSTGLVGIGTSLPPVPLVVAKDGTTGPTGITGTATVSYFSNTAQSRGLGVNYDDANVTAGIYPFGTNSKLCFYTPTAATYAERMRIDNQGRVGIGTTPAHALDVAGNIAVSQGSRFYLTNNSSFSPNITNLGDSNAMQFYQGGSERARIDSSGRLLVGASSAPTFATNSRVYVEGPDRVISSSNGQNINVFTSDSQAAGLGGGIAFGGRYEDGGSQYQFGAIKGVKANSTSGNAEGNLIFSTTSSTNTPTERLRIDSAGRVGIGTTSPGTILHLAGNNTASTSDTPVATIRLEDTDASTAAEQPIGKIEFYGNDITVPSVGPQAYILSKAAGTSGGGDIRFGTCTSGTATESARIDSSGRLLVGTSSAVTGGTAQFSRIVALGNSAGATNPGVISLGMGATPASGNPIGRMFFVDNGAGEYAEIAAYCDGTPGSGDYPGRLVFSTTADGAASPTERMRIKQNGDVTISSTGTSDPIADQINGTCIGATVSNRMNKVANAVLAIGRSTNDGDLVEFFQAATKEGSISVSGTTVSYNGAHLSRWSQLPSGAEREEILRGSVLSNIDEMCEWGDEDNEQLNRMKVSDVEGDKNVSGVFQAWDDDDDTYTNDFYCAMTGDFIIRIGAGVTVERGDLLMSAGDGTAKPQGDGFVQDKTIAKVTSTNVSCTYDDGSYCVPCVLMAC